MLEPTALILGGLIFIMALLYSSVGHAGASGYLAAMAFLGVSSQVMKPTALLLNLAVATITTVQFARAGCFSWRLFWPFAVSSVPMAFLGGWTALPGHWYKSLVGMVLLFAAWRQLVSSVRPPANSAHPPPIPVALAAGGVLGFVAGLTGTGGGIFLSPLLIQCRWAEPRLTAGVSAMFILVNSGAGLAGLASTTQRIPHGIVLWAAAAIVGGLVGSHFGSRQLGYVPLQRLLAAVLIVAGLKLILVK